MKSPPPCLENDSLLTVSYGDLQSVYVVLISFGVNQCVIVLEDVSVKS